MAARSAGVDPATARRMTRCRTPLRRHRHANGRTDGRTRWASNRAATCRHASGSRCRHPARSEAQSQDPRPRRCLLPGAGSRMAARSAGVDPATARRMTRCRTPLRRRRHANGRTDGRTRWASNRDAACRHRIRQQMSSSCAERSAVAGSTPEKRPPSRRRLANGRPIGRGGSRDCAQDDALSDAVAALRKGSNPSHPP